jgi:hypothetical protein
MNTKLKVINDADYLVPLSHLEAFADKIRHMAREEFGIDADGDSLVETRLVDRTRYEGSRYFLIPYEHKAETDEEREEIVRRLSINVGMAADALKMRIEINRDQRAFKRDREAKKSE